MNVPIRAISAEGAKERPFACKASRNRCLQLRTKAAAPISVALSALSVSLRPYLGLADSAQANISSALRAFPR
jgi:hypothetical protein